MAEGVGHPVPNPGVGDELTALDPHQEGNQRQVHGQDHEGQLPAVDRHHHQRSEDHRRVDDPRERSPLGEGGELLDVRGHPGDQNPCSRPRVIGEAEPVDVLEGSHPES